MYKGEHVLAKHHSHIAQSAEGEGFLNDMLTLMLFLHNGPSIKEVRTKKGRKVDAW